MSKEKANIAIEQPEEKMENENEGKAEQAEKSTEEKIQDLKNQAAERVGEVEGGFQKLLESTDGWGAEGQPEYKRWIRETIEDLRKGIDHVEKNDGVALVQAGYYEEVLEVFSTLERRIANVAVLEEKMATDPLAEKRLSILAKAKLNAKDELSFDKAGKAGSGYRVDDWGTLAKTQK